MGERLLFAALLQLIARILREHEDRLDALERALLVSRESSAEPPRPPAA